jgi:hypothetical protein
MKDRADAGRRVGHEGQAVGVSAEECGHVPPGRVKEPGQVTGQESDRLGLHPIAKDSLDLEDR